LGNNILDIAAEKAAIMKAGVPCIINHQTDEAVAEGINNVFHTKSQDLSPASKLYHYGSEFKIETNSSGSNFIWENTSAPLAPTNMLGQHQQYNIGSAIAAYRLIMGQDFDANILSPDNPKNPLGTIFWPGRLQQITSGTLKNLILPTQELWIDGGHNDSAGIFLAKQAQQWAKEDKRALTLILAMVKRKNPTEFLKPLIPHASQIICTEIPDEPETYTANDLYKTVSTLEHSNITIKRDINQALASIEEENSRILATGSLYFMGHILRAINV
jgi:dihydrofolate synthase/folylpolyglutamate synthase